MEYFRIGLSKEIKNPLCVKGLDSNYYKHNINRQSSNVWKMLVTCGIFRGYAGAGSAYKTNISYIK